MSGEVSLPPVLFEVEPPVKVLGVSQLEHELPLLAPLLPPLRLMPPPRRGRAQIAADRALADEDRQGQPHPQEVDVEWAHQVAEVQRLDGGLGTELEETLFRRPMLMY